MARKGRKQRVALRFKRREQIKGRARKVAVRSVAAALVVGFGVGLVTGGDSFLSRFMRRHTPPLDIQSPQALTGLPVLDALPKNNFWLWIPGSGFWIQKRVRRLYPAVGGVRVERHYGANLVRLRLEPRIPLVSWNGAGFDKDGVLFAMTPGTWGVLPQASFLATADKRAISRWLAQLAVMTEVWPQVNAVREDPDESIELVLKSGTVVIWGPMENEAFSRKAQMLARILDDAHHNMGGAARTDLRFFDQGRIIVLPKGR